MTVTRQWRYYSASQEAGDASFVVPDALTAGDVYVAVDIGNYTSVSEHGNAMSGLGVTWSRVAAAQNVVSEVWVGTGASNLPAGEIVTLTAPGLPGTTRRRLVVHCFRGVTSTVAVQLATGSATTVTTTSSSVGSGQVAIAFGYSDSGANALKNLIPSSSWESPLTIDLHSATRFTGLSMHIPSTTAGHTASASRASGSVFVTLIRLGDLDANPLTSTFTGWGNPIF